MTGEQMNLPFEWTYKGRELPLNRYESVMDIPLWMPHQLAGVYITAFYNQYRDELLIRVIP